MFNINLEETNKDINIQNKEVANRLNIIKVNISELYESKDNFYTINGIESLAEEIRIKSLQNPIKITREFEVISGHRRLEAYKYLALTSDKFNQIEAIVLDEFKSEEEKLLFLITENSSRVKTKEDRVCEMNQKKKLYTSLKNSGVEKYRNANITKILAVEYNVSEATIKRATTGSSKNKTKSPTNEFNKRFSALYKYMEKNSKQIDLPTEVYNFITDYYVEINQTELDLSIGRKNENS